MVDQNRYRLLNDKKYTQGNVTYWMTREHRVQDNWGLLLAQEMAIKNKTYFSVVFCLRSDFQYPTVRLIDFMLKGLIEVNKNLTKRNIPFYFLIGDPTEAIPNFIKEQNTGILVSDFHPLKPFRKWREKIAENLDIPIYEVDSRNVIPCWIASPKQEYGAYTFRSKYAKLLQKFLKEFPKLDKQELDKILPKAIDFENINSRIKIDYEVKKVNWIIPGEKAARLQLNKFISEKLVFYKKGRNDPSKEACSRLSPYLHFGHISAQRIVLELMKHRNNFTGGEAFIEELTVRRELADNYCFYNNDYDNFNGFPQWAKKTLNDHIYDKRSLVYQLNVLEKGQTHDQLWNAAMLEAIKTGYMHGYMRMYWAKKILEWTNNPNDAQKYAIYLMDKYFLDGRESNGFTGIAWSIGGVHDRAWSEREVFGKVRYMSYNGAKSKFKIQNYIDKVNNLA